MTCLRLSLLGVLCYVIVEYSFNCGSQILVLGVADLQELLLKIGCNAQKYDLATFFVHGLYLRVKVL